MKKYLGGIVAGLALVAASVQTASADAPKAGQVKTYTVGGVAFNMVYCPAGTYLMGTTDTESKTLGTKGVWPWAIACEKPHKVTLTKGFWISDCQVTQEQYKAVMGFVPWQEFPGDKIPVQRVNFADDFTFCQKLGVAAGASFRPPTEAEWEYACRAGTHTIYFCGDTIDGTKANYNFGNGAKKQIIAAKSYAPNAWGIYDMNGETHEWCLDRDTRIMDPEKPKFPKELVHTETYVDGIVDPISKVGDQRVTRNDGYLFPDIFSRCAFRDSFTDRTRLTGLGFRFVQADAIPGTEPTVPPTTQADAMMPMGSGAKPAAKPAAAPAPAAPPAKT